MTLTTEPITVRLLADLRKNSIRSLCTLRALIRAAIRKLQTLAAGGNCSFGFRLYE
jgi:hypothetical protein